jgi:OOP family OmpA-OmpF porin
MSDSTAPPDPARPRPRAPEEEEPALAELREILFHAERDELLALRERVHDPAQRARDVGEVLPDAVQLRAQEGPDEALTEAFRPTVERTLKESVQRDPQVMAEALFPAMGPAIRRAISEYFRTLVQAFDQAMQHSFSIRGIRWRIEALRTGRPFSEVALLHSLIFRVEQVFLIHRKTGLLLLQVAAPDATPFDPDTVSSMLSALQDFARDSFHGTKNDLLQSFEFGELDVWAEQGPQALLAVAIRGEAPQNFRLKMVELLERLHSRFGRALEEFSGDTGRFAATHDLLAECLVTQRRDQSLPPPRPYFVRGLVAALVLAAVWLGVQAVQDWRWGRFVDRLREQPGYVITGWSRGWLSRYYEIRGLRDPQAADPFALLETQGLNPARAEFQLSPYFSLDDLLVRKRAEAVLAPPPGVTLAVESGVLRVRGEAAEEWQRELALRAPLVAGVKAVDASGLLLPGQSDFVRQRGELAAMRILFNVGSAELRADQHAALDAAADLLKSLDMLAQQMGAELSVEVAGHTDRTGPDAANQRLSQLRAARVIQALERAGLRREIFSAHGAGFNEPLAQEGNEAERQINRSVNFRVLAPQTGARP